MPQVPYNPVPNVQPDMSGTPALRVQASPTAFGATVAQAIEHLGGTLEKSGDEIWNRAVAMKEIENRSVADKNTTEAIKQMGMESEDFKAQVGTNASPEALQAHLDKLESIRSKIGDGLDNPQVKRLYDSETRGFLSRLTIGSAGHAAAQQKVSASKSMDDLIEAKQDYVLKNPEDFTGFKQQIKDIGDLKRGQAGVRGWTPEQTEHEVLKAQSTTIKSYAMGLADIKPVQALQLIEQNQKLMRVDDYNHVYKYVQSNIRSVSATVKSDELNASDMSREEQTNAAKEWAKETNPNDPELEHTVVFKTQAGYDRKQRDIRRVQLENFRTVQDATFSDINPTDEKQLFAIDKKIQRAWPFLGDKEKAMIRKRLADNIMGDRPPTDEQLIRITQLKGMASDPNSGFSEMPLAGENIPRKELKELSALQKEQRFSPSLSRAMGIMQSDLSNVRMLKGQDDNAYYEFRGVMSDLINDFGKKHPGMEPTSEETLKMGRQAIANITYRKEYFGVESPFDTTGPAFRVPVPAAKVEAIRAKLKKEQGIEPTDDQIRRANAADQLIDKFGGAAKQPEVPPGTLPSAPALGGGKAIPSQSKQMARERIKNRTEKYKNE